MTSLVAIILTTILVNIFIIVSLKIEKKVSQNKFTERQALWYQALNMTLILLFPIALVYLVNQLSPVLSSIICAVNVNMFLKLVSYHMVNYWCRKDWVKAVSDH